MDLIKLGYPKEICEKVNQLKDIEIDSQNQKGGNGYLLFGYHKLLDLRVALKFYYYGRDSHQEVRSLSKVRSPNILKILNAQTIRNGFAYFMTEEITRGDLDDHIRNSPKSLRQAIKIVRGILKGVSAMHSEEHLLVHRDLKPENILIGTNFNPLIADFGSVKKLPSGFGYVNGSMHAALYRPPESYDGKYYLCSDLFQIGIIFFQILGGVLPYKGIEYLSNKEIIEYEKLISDYSRSKFVDNILAKKARRGKLLDFASLPFYVDHRVKRIIRKATNPDPNKRYQNVAQFEFDLHKLGILPDWRINDGEYNLLDFNNKDFRVIKVNNNYQCQKSKCKKKLWRKEGKIKEGTQLQVVKQIHSITEK